MPPQPQDDKRWSPCRTIIFSNLSVPVSRLLIFPFLTSPELFSKYFGETEKRIRDLFTQARSLSPCLLFIDEVDVLATKRDLEVTTSSTMGDDGVHARVLSQLLNEMDGIQEKHQVFLIACTSRIDRIDNAILRPGRFDQLIEVPLPSIEDRKELIRWYSQRTSLSSSVDSNELVKLTENFSGAAMDMLFREATLLAFREDLHATVINKEHLQKAFEMMVSDHAGPSVLSWQDGDWI